MIKEEEKFKDSAILEGMTSISALLAADATNDRRILRILIDKSKRKSKSAQIGFLIAKSHALGFPIEFTDTETIDSLALGTTHGGILAECTQRTLHPLRVEEIADGGFYVYLDGIEDPYNFGYTLRALYAAGVSGVILPPRNWMSAAGVVARASAGASERFPIYVAQGDHAIDLFHARDYTVLCAGIRDSVSIYEEHFSYPLLLVVGGEKRGISASLLAKADRIVRIDYGREFQGSLSAASAATVMAFELLRQNI